MTTLADMMENLRNYSGKLEWQRGKDIERMAGGDPDRAAVLEQIMSLGEGGGHSIGGMAGMIKIPLHEALKNPHAFALKHWNENTIPEGFYVHGRQGRQDLNTGHVIQLTKDWNVADDYAGLKGSRWLISPHEDSYIMDFSHENTRDMDKLVKKAIKQYYQGFLGNLGKDIEQAFGKTELDDADIEKAIRSSFAPKSIVDSAEAYDSPEAIEWLYSNFEPDFVHTPNGAVALNPDAIHAFKVPE